MEQDEFDLRLTQEMADLPPDPGEVQDYNPWQAAMSRILWGMALTTFRPGIFLSPVPASPVGGRF